MPTGYANQSNYIVNELVKQHQVCWYSHQYVGNEEVRNGYMQIPAAQIAPGDKPYGENRIDFYIQKYKPKAIAWLCDAFMIPWVKDRKTPPKCETCGNIKQYELWKDIKTLFYFPFDSEDVYEGAKELMEKIDYRVAMSKFGQKLLKDVTGLDSSYIPHCVDTTIFYPLAEEEKTKFREQQNLKDKFVVGMVGRNQTRKMPARLLYVFKEFAKDKPDAILMLHCDPYDPMGNNLVQLVKQLEIGDKVRYTGVSWFNGFPMPVLNQIYNMFDVHCMTTTGEGYGITTIEAMACGIPNVVTDYTTTKELLIEDGKCGEAVPYNDFVNGGYNTKRVLIDIPLTVEALNKLYYDKQLRQKYSEVGRNKVMRNNSTTEVLPKWSKLFGEICGAN